MAGWLVSATDTGAGKTLLTAAIAAWWLAHRRTPVAILKLVQCGPGDCEYYRAVFGNDLSVLNPQSFQAPLAPPLAAAQEGRSVDIGLLWQTYREAGDAHDLVLVEGVGGLGCPLGWDYSVADLARDWRLPVLLAAPVRLGVIGQLVAHTGFARALKLDLRAIVLSETSPLPPEQHSVWANTALIENLCHLPVLGTLPHLADPTDRPALIAAGSTLWLEGAGILRAFPQK
ncbi:dethiobiotin synthase [Gloeobacter kilaueensis]|uniref:ATP-dependent dethiobiotin synthetase BioD n=1 Tax=Gloeobacter kilaueensis (strain ATCC BAA-2537 / CCAP 1431/1 / ULC 316 / JS1) TaxID=1183438 RepID=U5QML3_GLOK1|nr:dethiobiotin synthase [Gloeobacter kilaueensis]AGY60166.1 dithiobiotin synthetase [Gloeobacter kilaueensis JS1]